MAAFNNQYKEEYKRRFGGLFQRLQASKQDLENDSVMKKQVYEEIQLMISSKK